MSMMMFVVHYPLDTEHFHGSPQAASVAEIIAGEVLWITQL